MYRAYGFKSFCNGSAGPEDLLAVLYEIELSVSREAVLLRQVVPACGKHLRVCVSPERTAAQSVYAALRSRLKRSVESDPVAEEHICIVMGTRSR